jgi:arginyl-tRNA synthetase
MKNLAQYLRVVRAAASTQEPHRIAFYLYDLASSFHSLWNMGKKLPQLRFICEDDAVTSARMALLRSVGHVIASGLGILGVEALKEMK